MEHNAEPDACDLLFELERLDLLLEMMDGHDHQRVCLYLTSCVPFEAVVDDQIVIRPMMYLALSYDHRIIDGRESVSFLKQVKELYNK